MLWDQKHEIITVAMEAGGLTLSRGRLEVEEVESHVGLDDLVLVVKGRAAEGYQLSARGLHRQEGVHLVTHTHTHIYTYVDIPS